MKNQLNTTGKLIKFVNQRPGLDFANYGDIKAYNAESREITRDRNDFFELLAVAQSRINDFEAKLKDYLKKSNGRLNMNEAGHLEYVTGQYFPTEYRPAAARIVADLIWADYRDEMQEDGKTPVYADGHQMRAAIGRRVSRRVKKNYFN